MNTTENTPVTAIFDAHHNGACWEAIDNDWNIQAGEYQWPQDREAIAARIVDADACYVETDDGQRHLVRA